MLLIARRKCAPKPHHRSAGQLCVPVRTIRHTSIRPYANQSVHVMSYARARTKRSSSSSSSSSSSRSTAAATAATAGTGRRASSRTAAKATATTTKKETQKRASTKKTKAERTADSKLQAELTELIPYLNAELTRLIKRRNYTLRVIVAEKLCTRLNPAVALDIARVLKIKSSGNFTQGYFGMIYPRRYRDSALNLKWQEPEASQPGFPLDHTVITWCSGHLLQIVPVEDGEESEHLWKLDKLPRVPQAFKLVPLPTANKKQLAVLKVLLAKATEIICATDAGREGELIFRDLYEYSKATAPVKRLWISSQTDEAILQGFSNLYDWKLFDNLYHAAQCRRIADWLFGINFTEFYTLTVGWRPELELDQTFNLKKDAYTPRLPTHLYKVSSQYASVFSVGRVQTPLLRFVVERYIENWSFKPEIYYEVKVVLPITREDKTTDTMEFYLAEPSELLSEDKNASNSTTEYTKKRFKTEHEAHKAIKQLGSEYRIIKVKSIEKREYPPLLYDLNTLQIEANQKYSLSSSQVLAICQSLYEKKLITYPRTNSRYLPPTTQRELKETVTYLTQSAAYKFLHLEPPLARINKLDPRIFCEAKVTDHHALLPTNPRAVTAPDISNTGPPTKVLDQLLSKLSPDERRIYDLIVMRLFAALSATSVKVEHEVYIEPTQQASPNRVILCGVTSHYKTPGWVLIHSVKNAQLEEIRSRTLRSKLLKRMPKTKESNNNTSSVTIPKSFTTAAPLFNTNSVLKSEESPQCVKHQTKPPSLHTDASLLYLMQHAARIFGLNKTSSGNGTKTTSSEKVERTSGGKIPEITDDDKEQDEPVQSPTVDSGNEQTLYITPPAWGLGTPATRAQIIQKLQKVLYTRRVGRYYLPTRKGVRIIKMIQDEPIASVAMTAEWERRLQDIVDGKEDPQVFLEDIRNAVKEEIMRLKRSSTIAMPQEVDFYFYTKGHYTVNIDPTLPPCPKCKNPNSLIMTSYISLFCSFPTCNFFIPTRLRVTRRNFAYIVTLSPSDVRRLLNLEHIVLPVPNSTSDERLEEVSIQAAERAAQFPSFISQSSTAKTVEFMREMKEVERKAMNIPEFKMPPIGYLTLHIDPQEHYRIKASFERSEMTPFGPLTQQQPIEKHSKSAKKQKGGKATRKKKTKDVDQHEDVDAFLSSFDDDDDDVSFALDDRQNYDMEDAFINYDGDDMDGDDDDDLVAYEKTE